MPNPPAQAEARTVEVMVAGDLLRVNSPKRLAALARHTTAVTLSQENNWRAAVPVTVDLAQLQARAVRPRMPKYTLPRFRCTCRKVAGNDMRWLRAELCPRSGAPPGGHAACGAAGPCSRRRVLR